MKRLALLLFVMLVCAPAFSQTSDTFLGSSLIVDASPTSPSAGVIDSATFQLSNQPSRILAVQVTIYGTTSALIIRDQTNDEYVGGADSPFFEHNGESTQVTRFVEFDRPLRCKSGVVVEATNVRFIIHRTDDEGLSITD